MQELALHCHIPLPFTANHRICRRRGLRQFERSGRKSIIAYGSATTNKRGGTPLVETRELESDGYYLQRENDEEEEDATTSSSSLLSLSMKPDRTMAMLDDYEMEEMDFVNDDPNHRSGYVAVVGKPNVGKSTLSNQMLGQKLSIVTDKPQTTRHRILGICSGSDYQVLPHIPFSGRSILFNGYLYIQKLHSLRPTQISDFCTTYNR